jgi:hypothetical protein
MSQPKLPHVCPHNGIGIAPLSLSQSFPQSTPPIIPPREPNDPAVHPQINTSGVSARTIFVEFVERYLGIDGLLIGFQSRFGYGSDLILFRSPLTRSTLAVECSVMLEPHLIASAIIKEKIRLNEAQFAGG